VLSLRAIVTAGGEKHVERMPRANVTERTC
jgi:hypothetical protein